jgi:hypothetical protein
MNKKRFGCLKNKLLILTVFLFAFNYTSAKPTISFDMITYDFGEIFEAEGIVAYDFNFTNTGNEPLHILKVKSSCGCALPEWSRGFIKPGQRGYVRVLFNPKNRLGKFVQNVWVLSNDQYIPVKLILTGFVLSTVPKIGGRYDSKAKEHFKVKDARIDPACKEGEESVQTPGADKESYDQKAENVIVRYILGNAYVGQYSEETWQPLELNQIVYQGSRIKTGKNAKVELEMPDGSIFKLSEQTVFMVDEIRVPHKHTQDRMKFSVLVGNIWARFKKLVAPDQKRIVESPTTVVAVRGTTIQMNVDSLYNTYIRVEDGSAMVRAIEFSSEFMLYAGQELLIKKGIAPTGPGQYEKALGEDPGMCLKWENDRVVPDDTEDPGICLKCQNGRVVVDDTESPGLCQKCQNGKAVIDNTEEVGPCMKCEDGTPVQDDLYDPGMCQQCQNGEIIPDDTEDPGECKKCQNGDVVNDDFYDPGECLKCRNGEVVPDDMEDPGECMKCENGKAVPDNNEFVQECWKCSDGRLVPDNTQTCDDGDPCTKNDRCVNGECIGDPVTSDENPDCQ